jgi:hypothetical protein
MTDAVHLATQIAAALQAAQRKASTAYLIESCGHQSTAAATVRDNARLKSAETFNAISISVNKAMNLCADTIMRQSLQSGDYSPKREAKLPPLTIGDDAVTIARAIDQYLAASFVMLPDEIRNEFDLRALSLQIVGALNERHGVGAEMV